MKAASNSQTSKFDHATASTPLKPNHETHAQEQQHMREASKRHACSLIISTESNVIATLNQRMQSSKCNHAALSTANPRQQNHKTQKRGVTYCERAVDEQHVVRLLWHLGNAGKKNGQHFVRESTKSRETNGQKNGQHFVRPSTKNKPKPRRNRRASLNLN